MGFEPPLEEFLLAGVSGLTVDFVDNTHMLVTFGRRELMRRDPKQRPGDEDRMIRAVLVELPTGKVLASTEWRVHDGFQYLWNLGHGRFLLRIRDQLTILAPLEQIGRGDPFLGRAIDIGGRHVVALLVSSNKDLLTIESTPQDNVSEGSAGGVSFSGTPKDEAPVLISFYRLGMGPEGLSISDAGVVRTRSPIAVPMTTAGILGVLSGGKNRWLFNFNEHAGKVDELAEWDTSCMPQPTFVGHSEFVAFGCRGSEDKPDLGGFNIKGEQMWEQGLYDSFVAPNFAFAPEAGRFALERVLVSVPIYAETSVPAGALQGEEVRVYQTYNGKILLKVNTSPVERAGQNFALSPDGMQLAVFEQNTRQRTTQLGDPYTDSTTSLVIYSLPPLTEQDQASVKEMQAKAPVDTGARIDASLVRMASEDGSDDESRRTPEQKSVAANTAAAPGGGSGASAAPGTANGAAAPGGTGQPESSQEPGNPAMSQGLPNAPGPGAGAGYGMPDEDNGEPTAPRKPPTLYGPDEKKDGNDNTGSK